MKLKGKLFTSFGSVMIFSLIILGMIIHYSFTENTIRNGEEILRLKVENLSHHTQLTLREHTNDIRHTLRPYLNNGRIKEQQALDASQKLTAILNADRLLSAIFIADRNSGQVLIQATRQPENRYSVLSQSLMRNTTDSFFLADVDDKLFLSWQPFPHNNTIIAAAELNRKNFRFLFDSLFDINQSIIFLTDGNGKLLTTIDHAEDLTCKNFDAKLAETCTHGINTIPNSDGYLYRHQDLFFGNHTYLLINEDYFFKELHSLKNRIIIGILIVGWLLIWVIMIFAHKISSPITKLSQITHDIIVLNYDTELKTPKSTDEIGELYENFETMRRKLKDLITKDPLTHVYNRRFLMHVFEIATLKALRLEQAMSCIMLDIDFFKEVNDQHGHQCGDSVLSEIGRHILKTSRPYDTPARYGGEEFILILPDTDIDVAVIIAERLRESIAALQVKCGDKSIQCTISLGVADFIPHEADTPDAIIANADFALYEAKRKGRNQTVAYENGMSICHDCSAETTRTIKI